MSNVDEKAAWRQRALDKGLKVDSAGVPEADPDAVKNFANGDVVTFESVAQGVLSGVFLGFDKDSYAVVTVDGEDWRVEAGKLQDGLGGL